MTHEEFEAIAALDAIGAATDDEARALGEHLESCAPCRAASDEYAEAATLLARDLDPVQPPRAIRDRVLGDTEEEDSASGGGRWWLAIAATLFLALWGWREIGIRVAREHVRSQQAEIERLRDKNQTIELQREKLAADLAALAAPETETIALTGQQVAPSASARVFVEPQQRRAIVVFANLPQNPDDKSYQLWIIRGDQPKPQSAGVFDVRHGAATIAIENLPVMTEIKALAVTMEPRGGMPQPTNATYYVMGGRT